MSATLSIITRPAVLISRLSGACLDRILRHHIDRTAITHLSGLEDAALSDIGISRSEIEAAVHGTIGLPKA
ncbi:MAG TPA: DUF1127 domain-containing protein [Dongiaceae bacterium]|nr:DUF1127 domain-containing protein [Dongiaceae bacterium]